MDQIHTQNFWYGRNIVYDTPIADLQENCQELLGLPPTYCDLNRSNLVPKAVRHLIDPET